MNETTKRILAIMRQKGLSAAAVAKAVGIAPSNFTEWKKGNNNPGYGAVIKIADYLGVSPRYLLGEQEQPQAGVKGAAALFVDGVTYDDLSPEQLEDIKQYIEFVRTKKGNT